MFENESDSEDGGDLLQCRFGVRSKTAFFVSNCGALRQIIVTVWLSAADANP